MFFSFRTQMVKLATRSVSTLGLPLHRGAFQRFLASTASKSSCPHRHHHHRLVSSVGLLLAKRTATLALSCFEDAVSCVGYSGCSAATSYSGGSSGGPFSPLSSSGGTGVGDEAAARSMCSGDAAPIDEVAALRVRVDELTNAFVELHRVQQEQSATGAVGSSGSAGVGSVAGGGDNVVPHVILSSVVKVLASVAVPNYLMPWQRKLQQAVTGTAFVVDASRRLILTNTHVIAHATFIEVRKHGSATRHVANVVYVGCDCDLALLHVADDSFWTDVAELRFETAAGAAQGAAGDDEGAGGTQVTTPSDASRTPAGGSVPGSAASPPATGLEAVAAISLFDGLPTLQRSVKVVGYPVGGDQISITGGVVSRIDMSPYPGVDRFLVAIQIDAAVNPGNSGGPALCDDRVVGVAFQSLTAGDNISYLVPNPVIAVFARSFLRYTSSIAAGRTNGPAPAADPATAGAPPSSLTPGYHGGFPGLGVYYQAISNAAIRARFGVTPKESGFLVKHVIELGPSTGLLKANDVVLSVDGFVIAEDLTVEWRPRHRIRFNHIVQMKDDPDAAPVTLEVLRDKQRVRVIVRPGCAPSLTPNSLFDHRYRGEPVFSLLGGFVFTTSTVPYLMEWGAEWFNNGPRHLTWLTTSADASRDRKELVVVSQVLPHAVNQGYDAANVVTRIVGAVNGTQVRDFAHFEQMRRQLKDDTQVILTLENCTPGSVDVVFDVAAARAADEQLKRMYAIPA